jgi:hypothetical protein
MKTNDYEQSQEKKPILVYSKLSTVIHITKHSHEYPPKEFFLLLEKEKEKKEKGAFVTKIYDSKQRQLRNLALPFLCSSQKPLSIFNSLFINRLNPFHCL